MTRPVIGLTTGLTTAKWSVWEAEAVVLAATYVTAVERVGAVPVLLPANGGDAWDVLSRLDGMVFIGGADVNPGLYGATPHPATQPVPEHLDIWQLSLVRAAIQHNVPFLGICRGMQLLNVAQGGTLHQHLPDVVGHSQHQAVVGIKGRHTVKIASGSVLEPIMGDLEPEVVSYHHQAIDNLGAGLTPIAWAQDGTIEAVHLANHPWGIGVQWHPEEDSSTLIKSLVDTVAPK